MNIFFKLVKLIKKVRYDRRERGNNYLFFFLNVGYALYINLEEVVTYFSNCVKQL